MTVSYFYRLRQLVVLMLFVSQIGVLTAYCGESLEGQAIVRMKSAKSMLDAETDINSPFFTVHEPIDANLGLFHILFADTLDPDSMIIELMKDPDVEFAEPVFITESCPVIPNDTEWDNQWGLYDVVGRNELHPMDWTGSGLYPLGWTVGS
jgi:hypothetical protein